MIEYQRDLSLFPDLAMTAYFCSQMNVRKRQLVCEMSNSQVTIQAGSMQWMLGNVNATTGIKKASAIFLARLSAAKLPGNPLSNLNIPVLACWF